MNIEFTKNGSFTTVRSVAGVLALLFLCHALLQRIAARCNAFFMFCPVCCLIVGLSGSCLAL